MAIITTTKGDMDESLLEKKVSSDQHANGVAHAIEYHHEGVLVKRSVHFTFDPDYVLELINQ
jgi:hypothetical protein